MGRSLKNSLYNLDLTETAQELLKKEYGVKLDTLYELEPDAGLGNGGLGRLAACFLDGLATASVPAIGYSLLYEYGIFRQKLVDGWQTELPDYWLPGGESWLLPRPELAKEVKFDGRIEESWDGEYHHVEHKDATVVIAQPFDMMVAGKDGRGVSTLRLWRATAPGMDMSLFNQGEYMRAMEQKAMAEVITQVLYPADNHREGKSLRLSQQYFLVSASVQDIVRRHLEQYGTLDSLPEMAAVHVNDTHPTLAIPELMRIMLDECRLWVGRCVANRHRHLCLHQPHRHGGSARVLAGGSVPSAAAPHLSDCAGDQQSLQCADDGRNRRRYREGQPHGDHQLRCHQDGEPLRCGVSCG